MFWAFLGGNAFWGDAKREIASFQLQIPVINQPNQRLKLTQEEGLALGIR
jgi:hypothetical protein